MNQSNRVTVFAINLLALIGLGCEPPSVTSADTESETSTEAAETPESLAKENSAEALADLAASDKGVDEDGEKVWKQEAREYFDTAKNPKNRTFELPWKWAKEFTDKAYAAGAEQVWMTQISEFELGDHKFNMSDNLVVVLPSDPIKRAAIFGLYNSEMTQGGGDPMKDVGQRFISIIGD